MCTALHLEPGAGGGGGTNLNVPLDRVWFSPSLA